MTSTILAFTTIIISVPAAACVVVAAATVNTTETIPKTYQKKWNACKRLVIFNQHCWTVTKLDEFQQQKQRSHHQQQHQREMNSNKKKKQRSLYTFNYLVGWHKSWKLRTFFSPTEKKSVSFTGQQIKTSQQTNMVSYRANVSSSEWENQTTAKIFFYQTTQFKAFLPPTHTEGDRR